MKNKLLSFFMILVIGFVVISCGDENNPPTANAGTNFEHNITTHTTTIQLNGSGTDPDGDPITYAWTNTSQPTGAAIPVFSNSAIANPTVSGFNRLGEYQFTLKVKDDKDAESTASVVTVTLVRTASTTLNIESNAFSATPGTELNFAPSYTGISNPSDFNTALINSNLTYTVTVVNHDSSYTHTWNSANSFDGIIPPRSEYGTDLATFTQTFYHNGEVKGSRSLKVMVADNKFEYFGDSYSGSGNVPAINGVSINRKVTEGVIIP